MQHTDLLAALDQRLDALVTGRADYLSVADDTPDAIELEQMVTAARLAMRVLEQPLPRATRARHLRMLKAEAARRRRAEQGG